MYLHLAMTSRFLFNFPKKLSTRSRLMASFPSPGLDGVLMASRLSWWCIVWSTWQTSRGACVCVLRSPWETCVVLAPCKYRVTWCQVYRLVRITETFIRRQDPEPVLAVIITEHTTQAKHSLMTQSHVWKIIMFMISPFSNLFFNWLKVVSV